MTCILPIVLIACAWQAVYAASKLTSHLKSESLRLEAKQPIFYNDTYVMFWRPQKVGSSTLLSIFLSFGFRYNYFPRAKSGRNSFCSKIMSCAYHNPEMSLVASELANLKKAMYAHRNHGLSSAALEVREELVERVSYRASVSHEICDYSSDYIRRNLQCAFKSKDGLFAYSSNGTKIKEVFMVRDPIARIISIYYFWGELSKLATSNYKKLGAGTTSPAPIKSNKFLYHGNESSVPNLKIAKAYAKSFPLMRGMPGPSFTWSAFSDNVRDAAMILRSGRIMSVVTERLDESLVVLSHYLNWSIADMVIIAPRKALSTHPKHTAWPEEVINDLKDKLDSSGEYRMYESAKAALDDRIEDLNRKGVEIAKEVNLLRKIRSEASNVCLTDNALEKYRKYLEKDGLTKHYSQNKLRDTEDKFVRGGHLFSLNGEILYSYDVCGSCEAHALLLAYKHNLNETHSLATLPLTYRQHNPNFSKCP